MHWGLRLTAQWLSFQTGDRYRVHRIGQIMAGSVDLLVNHLNGRRGGFMIAVVPYLGRHAGL
jgi:hypothetical protein